MIESWLKVLIQNGPNFFPRTQNRFKKKDCDEKKKNAKNQTQDVFLFVAKKAAKRSFGKYRSVEKKVGVGISVFDK